MTNLGILIPQRGSASKPRVARHELPWVWSANDLQPQRPTANGVAPFSLCPHTTWGATLSGFVIGAPVSQGSSCLATLGFETKSLWDLRKCPNLSGTEICPEPE